MLKEKRIIPNKLGLHARAAVKLINIANRYQSDVELEYQGRRVNAKSILCVMALGASCGATIEVIVTGIDETDAMTAITTLIDHKFHETE